MKENTESVQRAQAHKEAFVASARSMANQLGFRVMHCRNGQYWLMFAEPMTIYDIDRFFATGFKMMNGEPGHFHFEPVAIMHRGEQTRGANPAPNLSPKEAGNEQA
jgi:hypothetical protein